LDGCDEGFPSGLLPTFNILCEVRASNRGWDEGTMRDKLARGIAGRAGLAMKRILPGKWHEKVVANFLNIQPKP